jgi:hypothetical protein
MGDDPTFHAEVVLESAQNKRIREILGVENFMVVPAVDLFFCCRTRKK